MTCDTRALLDALAEWERALWLVLGFCLALMGTGVVRWLGRGGKG